MPRSEPPHPTVAVGGVVLDDDRRLLVVRRGRPPAAGRWTVPGGRVEPGEGVTEAVAREVAEETGLDVEVGPFAWWLERRDDDHHYVILDFFARPVGGTLRPGDDADDVRWATRSELEALALTPGLLAFFDDADVDLAP